MARVVMLGIDGLDADLLRVYGPSLPHIRLLMLESPFLELKSSFPPETASTWASLYTGLNPANHGVLLARKDGAWDGVEPIASKTPSQHPLHSLSPGRGTRSSMTPAPDGETFWDIAERAGKRVCVVKPPVLTAPLIPSNRQLGDFCSSLQIRTLQQAEDAMEIFQQEPWDIFFLQLDALDHVQHFLWRYNDPGDITYPGRNKHSGRIFDFYRLFDSIVGRFRSEMEPDCVLVIVSAHGHGRSCTQCLNLNEWLHGQNLLTPRMRSARLLDRRYLLERAKHHSIGLLMKLQRQRMMPHFPQYLPGRNIDSHSACMIDQQATMAQVAQLTGTAPFGGILLNRACIERNGEEYEHVRMSLLQRLTHWHLKGGPVIHWAEKRENVYQGKYVESYPDILFELRSDLGVSTNIYVPLVSNNPAHHLLSGDHRMHGVLLLGNLPAEVRILEDIKEPLVMDVAPTVLRLVNVVCDPRDGQALLLPYAPKLMT